MKKKIISTDKAPSPIGPYNQAVEVNGILFISGQIALNPESGELIDKDIREEARQVMQNLGAILQAAEMTFAHVVKTTILLSDMSLFGVVNEVYATYFEKDFPARETFAVKGLPKNAHIEISMVASV